MHARIHFLLITFFLPFLSAKKYDHLDLIAEPPTQSLNKTKILYFFFVLIRLDKAVLHSCALSLLFLLRGLHFSSYQLVLDFMRDVVSEKMGEADS